MLPKFLRPWAFKFDWDSGDCPSEEFPDDCFGSWAHSSPCVKCGGNEVPALSGTGISIFRFFLIFLCVHKGFGFLGRPWGLGGLEGMRDGDVHGRVNAPLPCLEQDVCRP